MENGQGVSLFMGEDDCQVGSTLGERSSCCTHLKAMKVTECVIAGGGAIHCRSQVISNSTPRQCGRQGSLLFEILQFHELNLKGKERGHDQNGEIRVQSARCHVPQCPYTHTVKQLLVHHPSSCIDLTHRLPFNFASTTPQPPLMTPFGPPNTQWLMPQVLASTTRLSTRVMCVRLKTLPSDLPPEPCKP